MRRSGVTLLREAPRRAGKRAGKSPPPPPGHPPRAPRRRDLPGSRLKREKRLTVATVPKSEGHRRPAPSRTSVQPSSRCGTPESLRAGETCQPLRSWSLSAMTGHRPSRTETPQTTGVAVARGSPAQWRWSPWRRSGCRQRPGATWPPSATCSSRTPPSPPRRISPR
ncbi:Uncharacterized protein PODLI_1B040786 [Podarcis lilfordi]|uniref:Uncharacterized protein n=1 Tax=Podarcis lilfordi TaxID=74358 RepID=A0AA35KJY0_9SAUR|nr:Uncharacterized protein PODLI_1B040786 [Podarcis lilfordi]